MFKILFVAALSGAILSTGALSSSATAATQSAPAPFFNLSTLDQSQRALVQEVLDEFDFNWTSLRHQLRLNTGRRSIPVRVQDVSDWHALALSWPSGLIQMDDDVVDPELFKDVFRHELGHIVDFYLLEPEHLHREVARIYGAPWKVMWHDFNDGFIQVASSHSVGDATYALSDEDLLELRVLLGLKGPLPTKVI